MASLRDLVINADLDEDDNGAQIFIKLLKLPSARDALMEALNSGIPQVKASRKDVALERLVECMIALNQQKELSKAMRARMSRLITENKKVQGECSEFERQLVETKTRLAMDEERKEELKMDNRRLRRMSMGMGVGANAAAANTNVASPAISIPTTTATPASTVDASLVKSNKRLAMVMQAVLEHAKLFLDMDRRLKTFSSRLVTNLQSVRLASKTSLDNQRKIQQSLDDMLVRNRYQMAEIDKLMTAQKAAGQRQIRMIRFNAELGTALQQIYKAVQERKVKSSGVESVTTKTLLVRLHALASEQGKIRSTQNRLVSDMNRALMTWKQRRERLEQDIKEKQEEHMNEKKAMLSELEVLKSRGPIKADLGPLKTLLPALCSAVQASQQRSRETRSLATFQYEQLKEGHQTMKKEFREDMAEMMADHREKLDAMRQFMRNMEIEMDRTKLQLEQEKAQVRRLSAGEQDFRRSFTQKDGQLLRDKVIIGDLMNRIKHTDSKLEIVQEELRIVKEKEIEAETQRIKERRLTNKKLAGRIVAIQQLLLKEQHKRKEFNSGVFKWAQKNSLDLSRARRTVQELQKKNQRMETVLQTLQPAIQLMALKQHDQHQAQGQAICRVTSLARGKLSAFSDQVAGLSQENTRLRDELERLEMKWIRSEAAQKEASRRREFRQSLASSEAESQIARLKQALFLMTHRRASDNKALGEMSKMVMAIEERYTSCKANKTEEIHILREKIVALLGVVQTQRSERGRMQDALKQQTRTLRLTQNHVQIKEQQLVMAQEGSQSKSNLLTRLVPVLQAQISLQSKLPSKFRELATKEAHLTHKESSYHEEIKGLRDDLVIFKRQSQLVSQRAEAQMQGVAKELEESRERKRKDQEMRQRMDDMNRELLQAREMLERVKISIAERRVPVPVGANEKLSEMITSIQARCSALDQSNSQLKEKLTTVLEANAEKDLQLTSIKNSFSDMKDRERKQALVVEQYKNEIQAQKELIDKSGPVIAGLHWKDLVQRLAHRMTLQLEDQRKMKAHLIKHIEHENHTSAMLKGKLAQVKSDFFSCITSQSSMAESFVFKQQTIMAAYTSQKEKAIRLQCMLHELNLASMALIATFRRRVQMQGQAGRNGAPAKEETKQTLSVIRKQQMLIAEGASALKSCMIRMNDEATWRSTQKQELAMLTTKAASLLSSNQQLISSLNTHQSSLEQETVAVDDGREEMLHSIYGQLESQNSRISLLISDMEDVRDGLESMVPAYKLEESRQSLAELSRKHEAQQVTINKLEDELESSQSRSATLESNLRSVLEHFDKSRSNISQSLQRLEIVKQTMSSRAQGQDHQELEAKIVELSECLEETRRTNTELKDHIDDLIEDRSRLIERKEIVPAVNSRLKSYMSSLIQRMKKQQASTASFRTACSVLVKRVSDTRSFQAALRKQLEALNGRCMQLGATDSRFREVVSELHMHCKLERSDLLAEVIGLQDSVSEERRRGVGLCERIRVLERSLAEGQAPEAPALNLELVAQIQMAVQQLVARYRGKCSEISELKAGHAIAIQEALQQAQSLHSSLTQNFSRPPPTKQEDISLDPQSEAVADLIADLANELAETQDELAQALELLKVKLVEDQEEICVQRVTATDELNGLRGLNDIERARSVLPA